VADLDVPRGAGDRPWNPLPAMDAGVDADLDVDLDVDPEPDRVRVAGRTSAAGPGPGISVADAPDWLVDLVDQANYPTRMARRRALAQAQVNAGWRPDPWVTSPLLEQVHSGLEELFQRPWDEDERATPEAVVDQAAAPEPTDGPTDEPAAAGYPAPTLAPATVTPPARRPPAWRSLAWRSLAWRSLARRRRVAVLLVLALVVGAGALALARRAGRADPGGGRAQVAAPQRLLAVVLVTGGQLTGLSLLASGGGDGQQVLVPSRLLLDVPGAGRMSMAQALAVGDGAPTSAVADALGVRVAGTWVLDAGSLARLVDRLGGVDVDVDVDVPASGRVGAAILVPAGTRRLTGAQAAAYAGLLVAQEPEAARLARQQRVITALLAALPAADAERRALLAALPGGPTGAGLGVTAAVTGGLRTAAAAGSLASTVVPVTEIDSGGAVPAYGLDTAGAARLTRERLAGVAIAEPVGGRVRVLVQNGVGTPGLGEVARARLVAAGLRYVGGGNVAGFGVADTVVLLPDAASEQRARGLAVARALGLDERALRVSDSAPTIADVVVVLGRDFRAP
jgi:LytR_cpsA_psr family/LytR cell envelope-related transcriptional attenuator